MKISKKTEEVEVDKEKEFSLGKFCHGDTKIMVKRINEKQQNDIITSKQA